MYGSTITSRCAHEALHSLFHINVLCIVAVHRDDIGCTESAIDLAASNGHVSIVVYLHSIGKPCSTSAADGACAGGHLQVLEFLHRYLYACSSTDTFILKQLVT